MNQLKRFWFPGALVILCAVVVLMIWKPTGSGSNLKDYGTAPDFQLEDTLGNQVTLDNTNGKVRVVYFFYTSCPDVCPPTTAMLSKLQTELKDRNLFADKTEILSITFDPSNDTTEQLMKYSAVYNADPKGWHFLRADEDYTINFARKLGISIIKDQQGVFMHQNIIALIDKKGQIRARYNANDLDITAETIAKDIQSLI